MTASGVIRNFWAIQKSLWGWRGLYSDARSTCCIFGIGSWTWNPGPSIAAPILSCGLLLPIFQCPFNIPLIVLVFFSFWADEFVAVANPLPASEHLPTGNASWDFSVQVYLFGKSTTFHSSLSVAAQYRRENSRRSAVLAFCRVSSRTSSLMPRRPSAKCSRKSDSQLDRKSVV